MPGVWHLPVRISKVIDDMPGPVAIMATGDVLVIAGARFLGLAHLIRARLQR
ncbi:hypothetical protein D3C80_2153860 [compost metagenome]